MAVTVMLPVLVPAQGLTEEVTLAVSGVMMASEGKVPHLGAMSYSFVLGFGVVKLAQSALPVAAVQARYKSVIVKDCPHV